MIEFKKLGKDVLEIEKYIEKSEISFCDISLGVKFMWRDDFIIDYAVENDTLILKESCPDYKDAFYYPIGKDVEGALRKIEEYSLKTNTPLLFCCIDNAHVPLLTARYKNAVVTNDRAWSDYIYDAKEFASFTGKKYSGQRNHINKFKKLYPEFRYGEITEKDLSRIDAFLSEFERGEDYSAWSKIEEEKKVRELLNNMSLLKQVGGYIEVEGKIVAISIGEIVGDTLICHVEKGLKDYEGVYPTMANAFAKKYCEKVKYINREEDCGDMGLRISKLQYHPIEIKEKNLIRVDTLFNKIVSPVHINTDRLAITEIEPEDKPVYKKLYLDDELNKYYGYDYREDLKGEATEDYFFNFMKGLKDKGEEYSLAIKKDGKFIGETVFHNFDFFGGVEIGIRIFAEYQGYGYGVETVKAMIDYAVNVLRATSVKAKCYIENEKSFNMLIKSGFKFDKEDVKYKYFILR